MRIRMAIVVALIAFIAATSHADELLSPGKSAAAARLESAQLNTGPLIQLQLLKGKRKRLLMLSATVATSISGFVFVEWGVNGVGAPGDLGQACNGSCTVSGTRWLDLDALELANPGLFIGVPLNVEVEVSASNAANADVSVTATLVKK